MADDDDKAAEYASPPCFLHELAPEFRPQGAVDVARWRKAERARLIEARLALSAEERQARSARIASRLDHAVGKVSGRIIGTYWPFKGEPDLRDWALGAIARGARIALPVVLEKGRPLEYRLWAPGDPLERGVWNILVPARGRAMAPDVAIAPLVGFDAGNYRLGYGGGFFDRTLAVLPPDILKIGVGYRESRIETIHPQPHDIPMDMIVTD